MWHSVTRSGYHADARSRVGLDDPRGLFQRNWLRDSARRAVRACTRGTPFCAERGGRSPLAVPWGGAREGRGSLPPSTFYFPLARPLLRILPFRSRSPAQVDSSRPSAFVTPPSLPPAPRPRVALQSRSRDPSGLASPQLQPLAAESHVLDPEPPILR